MSNEVAQGRLKDEPTGAAYRFVDKAALLFISLFSFVAVGLLLAMLILAAKSFYEAVVLGLQVHTKEGSNEALIACIHGLEFVFLAPLCYFLVRSLARLVEEYVHHQSPGEDAKADLIEVKSLVIGLLSSVLAADLVGHALNSSGLSFAIGFEIVIMTILCLNYFGLHILAHMARNGSHKIKSLAAESRARRAIWLFGIGRGRSFEQFPNFRPLIAPCDCFRRFAIAVFDCARRPSI